MARYFHNQISPGVNPQTINQKVLLRRLLQEALRLISKEEDSQKVRGALYSVVEDVAAALVGQNIQFLEQTDSPYPNGIKQGQNEFINEKLLYDGLPPIVTSDQFDKGIVIDYETFA